jgi:hypothetical protein
MAEAIRMDSAGDATKYMTIDYDSVLEVMGDKESVSKFELIFRYSKSGPIQQSLK